MVKIKARCCCYLGVCRPALGPVVQIRGYSSIKVTGVLVLLLGV